MIWIKYSIKKYGLKSQKKLMQEHIWKKLKRLPYLETHNAKNWLLNGA
jgi:hypothetical protein